MKLKKRKIKSKEVNDGHYLELMDRLYIQICSLEEHICGHPLTNKIKKAKKLIDKAGMSLAEAYQIVGKESYLNDKQKNGIQKVVFGRHKNSKN